MVQPVARADRYASLDILRGAALYGVLLVNLMTLFRVSLFDHILGRAGAFWPLHLLEFKAFALFSFLFGAGAALQSPHGALFLVRRFSVLLVIGLVHLILVWNGDILALYAICGFALIPLLRLPDLVLAATAAALIVIPHYVALPVPFPGAEAMQSQAAAATRVYAAGGFLEILEFRWEETRGFIIPLLLLALPKTLGTMLLGAAAWRSGLLIANRRPWMYGLVVPGAIGVAGTALGSSLTGPVPLALAYASAILLWLPRAPLLAAGGQMALTNYLTQSLVFSLVFYGYGLGWFGRTEAWTTAAAGTTFYILQLLFSRWWLERHPYGPAEWLWRSAAYGHRMPWYTSLP